MRNIKCQMMLQMWKMCKSRCWLVLNLSWYRRNYLFLLNFEISFVHVSIIVSTFETVIITEALTIPFSLFLLLCDATTCTTRDLRFYLVIERNTRTQTSFALKYISLDQTENMYVVPFLKLRDFFFFIPHLFRSMITYPYIEPLQKKWNCNFVSIISSPDPKAHWWAYSICRRPSSVRSRRQHFQTTTSLKPWSWYI